MPFYLLINTKINGFVMGLTRPKIWDIDTTNVAFNDPMTVLHQGALSANTDVGFLFNRANGLVSNVAIYWNETGQSFEFAYTANTGSPVNTTNIAVTSLASVTTGSIYTNGLFYAANGLPFASAVTTFQQVTGNTNPSIYTAFTLANTSPTLIDTLPVTGNILINWTITAKDNVNNHYTSTIVNSVNDGGNVYYTQYGTIKSNNSFNVATFTSNITSGNINLYAVGDSSSVNISYERHVLGSSTPTGYININGPAGTVAATTGIINTSNTTAATSTTTGALIVSGGAGIAGNVYTGNIFTSGLYYSSNGAVIQTGGGSSITYTAATAPPTTGNTVGSQWYNTTTDTLYEYAYDGTSYYWVDIQSPIINANVVIYGNTQVQQYLGAATGIQYGLNAGTSQGSDAVAVGANAGTSQGNFGVGIGWYAGNNQGTYAVAVGANAGQSGQGTTAVAIGQNAGNYNQSSGAVAIGLNAGENSQGTNSIAIGKGAGLGTTNAQASNSIIINATGNEVDGVASQSSSFYVTPIRNVAATSGVLQYNSSTYEITYSNTISTSSTITIANTNTSTSTSTGALTVAGGVGIQGNLNVGSYSNHFIATGSITNTSALTIAGNVYGRGGIGYLDAITLTNNYIGATNPNKWFRVDSGGTLQIINSAYSTNIFNLTDAGALTVPGPIYVNGNQAVNGPSFQVYLLQAQAFTTGSTANVIYQGTLYDTHSCYNTTTGVFKPTVAGYYQFNWTAGANSYPASSGIVTSSLKRNNQEYARGWRGICNSGGLVVGGSAQCYLNGSTDYVQVSFLQGSGGTAYLECDQGAITNNPPGSYANYFSGSMVRGA